MKQCISEVREKISADLLFGPTLGIATLAAVTTIALLCGADLRILFPLDWPTLPALTRGIIGIVVAFSLVFIVALPLVTICGRPRIPSMRRVRR